MHDRAPRGAVAIAAQRVLHRLLQRGRLVGVEQKTGLLIRDAVVQPPNPASDGDGAVPLRSHLREPARLVQRRHEEQVRPGEQPVLQVIGERELDRDTLRVGRGELGERRVVTVFPGAEEDELGVRAAEQVGAEHDVQPFLRYQARTHPEKRRMGALRQAVRLLQRSLAASLAGKIVDRVVRGDVRIRRGVPGRRIDPIEDPHDPVAQLDELLLQTEPAFRRQQLARVGGTDGDGQIGERQSALEDVHPAVPLEHPRVVQVTRQTQRGQGLGREMPLESGVVHRQHGA